MVDNIERQLPKPALYAVGDNQRQAIIDTSNQQLRQTFAEQFTKRENLLQKLCEQLGAGLLPFNTSEPVMQLLAKAYGKRRTAKKSN